MSLYDQLLDAEQQSNKYDALLDEDEQERKSALQQSLFVGTQRNPDAHAKVVDLTKRVPLPVETIERNQAQIESLVSRETIDYDKVLSETPALAEWLSDPENASVAHDDMKSLGAFEWLLKAPKLGLQQGSATVELGRLGMKAMGPGLSDEEEARIKDLNALSAKPTGADNFWSKAYVGTFKIAPQIGTSLLRGAEYGTGAAIGAGTAAAIAGQLGPQVATPEELVTVPAVAAAAFTTGAAMGSYTAARELEAGNAFLEFRAITDKQGQPIDPQIARVAAMAVGEVNALVELVGLGVLVKSFPGADKLLSGLTRETVKSVLAKPTVTAALGGLVKRYGTVWTAEVAQEVTQEAVTILGAEVSKAVAGEDFEQASGEQIAGRLGETAVSATQEFAIISALGPSSTFARDAVRVKRANENQKVFEALASTDSKLRQRLPEKFREFVAKAGGPLENVYIPAEKFVEYFQSQNIDPSEVTKQIPAVGEQMEEALASGGDLAIPMADFATYIAPSEHYAGLSQDLRLRPEDMTLREAVEWEKQSEKMAKDAAGDVKPDASQPIFEDVTGQLLATGMERSTAERNAKLMQSAFRSLGERTGQDPLDLYRQYNLTVRRGLPPALRSQLVDELDEPLNAIRSQKVPTDKQIFGTSLVSFLKSKGGLQEQGGELSARDVKKAFPGLVKKDGMTLDHASEAAIQAGYITERSDRALLEALDRELSGKPVYAAGSENQALLSRRATIEAMEEFLSREGIDIKTATNEEIKARIRQPKRKEFDQPAFHGSPHDFDKFSLEKIGTGEGAQAFGWGLYFAENPDVASEYRRVGQPVWIGPQAAKAAGDAYKKALSEGLSGAGAIKRGRTLLHEEAQSTDNPYWRQMLYDAHNNFESLTSKPPGNLYTVEIQDEAVEKMLDWDKKISTQSEGVRQALETIDDPMFREWQKNGAWPHVTGETLYRHLSGGLTQGAAAAGKHRDASLLLAKHGIPGVKYLDAGSRKDGGTRNFVVFDDSVVTITHKDGSKVSPKERKEFFQSMTAIDDKRGSVQFGGNQTTINLFDKADLSTFLHESGHFYLEVLGDIAASEKAPQQIKDDYAKLLKWFGVKDRSEIKVDHHEKFARGFEAYLFEGKAPSVDLQTVFARFRAWLVSIYRQIKNLNVDLTDEVREVMDRLLATDDEIAAAQEAQEFVPLFTTAEAAGMSPTEFAAYRETIEAARIEAEESMSAKLLADLTREQKAWWKEERTKMRAEVEAEVHEQPVYRALAFLQRGTNPNGSEIEGVTAVKLSKEALTQQYGAPFLKRLPKPFVYSKEGGVAPEIIATMFGFGSGDELVKALVNVRPMKQVIEGETDIRMREKYGDALNDGQLADQAIVAVNNEKRTQLLAAELKALKRKQREVNPFIRAAKKADAERVRAVREANFGNVPDAQERKIIRRAAEQAIEGKRVREINPAQYRAAATQAARKSFEAAGKNDFETAYFEKRKQLLNHELYRAAVKAREEIEKTVEYLREFDRKGKRAALGKAGADYLEQVDAIRERFDFSQISNIGSQKRLSLVEWVLQKQKDGQEIELPRALLNEALRKSYKELTYSELQAIRDTVSNIDHLARLKNKLLARADQADYETAVAEIVSAIEANHTRKAEAPDFAPNWRKRIKEGMQKLAAEHTKMEFLFTWLDGEKEAGPIWRALFKPLADAESAEQAKMRDARKALHDIFEAYTKAERATWNLHKIYVPEVGASFTKATLLAVALNTGNQYNKDVLLRGYKWNEGQLNILLSKLDDRDWETVQKIWDHIDSYWGEIKALQKELTGLDPDKVEATPFVSPTGRSMKGGYYPIQYDSRLSWKQQSLEEEQSVQELYGGQWLRASTRQGHTKARTDSGGKAIRLDLGVVTEHVVNVIHDLTHRRALLDVDRLATSNRVREAIEQTAGKQMYRQLRPWLRNIATDYRAPMTAPEAILNHARAGATIVNMGWKITTAIVQPLGYFNSVELLGPKYAAIGLRETFVKGDPYHSIKRAKEFAFERSEQLRNRMTTFDRDVRDQLKRLTESGYSGPVRRSFFFMTGLMDMSVSVPTWMGAYRKAMDGAVDGLQAGDEKAAIDYADSILRRSQSAGGSKDLAGIQAQGPLLKLFTTFYSYFSVLYNLFARRVKLTDIRKPGDLAHLAGSLFVLWLAPAILSEIVAGRGPEDDESWGEYLKRTAHVWGFYPTQSIVLLRDVMNATGHFGYDGSPALEAFEQTARAMKIPVKMFDEDEDVSRTDAKAAVLATSYWGHLPGRQAWITGSYLFDWMTGEEQPESVAEVAQGLAFARRQ